MKKSLGLAFLLHAALLAALTLPAKPITPVIGAPMQAYIAHKPTPVGPHNARPNLQQSVAAPEGATARRPDKASITAEATKQNITLGERVRQFPGDHSTYLLTLAHHLQQHFTKFQPLGLAGQAKLEIMLTADGTLLQSHLKEKTSQPFLNELLQKTAHAASPYPTPPLELVRTPIIVPIHFSTTE